MRMKRTWAVLGFALAQACVAQGAAAQVAEEESETAMRLRYAHSEGAPEHLLVEGVRLARARIGAGRTRGAADDLAAAEATLAWMGCLVSWYAQAPDGAAHPYDIARDAEALAMRDAGDGWAMGRHGATLVGIAWPAPKAGDPMRCASALSALAFPPEAAWRAVHEVRYADADGNGLYDRADAGLRASAPDAREVMDDVARATQAVVLAAASETQDDDGPAHDALEKARQIAKAHPRGAELARIARQWMVDTPARLIAYTTFTERGGE